MDEKDRDHNSKCNIQASCMKLENSSSVKCEFWDPAILDSGFRAIDSGFHGVESRIQDCLGFPYVGRNDSQKS